MVLRFVFTLFAISIAAEPAFAQNYPCGCNTPEKTITYQNVIVENCGPNSVCNANAANKQAPVWHPAYHRHFWRPQYYPVTWHHPHYWRHHWTKNIALPPAVIHSKNSQSITTAGQNTINIYTGPTAGTTSNTNTSDVSKQDISDLKQRIDTIDAKIRPPDGGPVPMVWWAALIGLALALPILLFAIWALRGQRRDHIHRATCENAPAEDTVRLHNELWQKDSKLERIYDELLNLRREMAFKNDTLTRSGLRESPPHTEHPREHTAHSPQRATESVTDAMGLVAMRAVAGSAAHVAHRPSPAPAPRRDIDEANWSVTDYQAAIGEARHRTHERPKARHDIIHYSDQLLARYPHHEEAGSYALVSKGEALAANGEYAAALAECETVITKYSATTEPNIRIYLAHAHYIKAAIYAKHKDVPACCAALDQWATIHGSFDQDAVVKDIRFKDVINVEEFREYLSHKSV